MAKLLLALNDEIDLDAALILQADIVMLNGSEQNIFDLHQKLLNDATSKISKMPEIWLSYQTSNAVKISDINLSSQQAVAFIVSENDTINDIIKQTANINNAKIVYFVDVLSDMKNEIITNAAQIAAKGIVLQNRDLKQHIFNQMSMTDIGYFINKARQMGLETGVSGGLEAPDIPRLLTLQPNYLDFTHSTFIKEGHMSKERANSMLRTLLPIETHDKFVNDRADLGTDRILVKNFVLSMKIGAYKREFLKKQNVRFNVVADIARISDNPEDMSHIFSYDLILDAIRHLAELEHIELVETLAERLASRILVYPRVTKIMVRVEKLDLGPEAVGIEIERSKKQ